MIPGMSLEATKDLEPLLDGDIRLIRHLTAFVGSRHRPAGSQ